MTELLRAIDSLGKTDPERAARLGVSVRTLGRWRAEGGIKTIAPLLRPELAAALYAAAGGRGRRRLARWGRARRGGWVRQ